MLMIRQQGSNDGKTKRLPPRRVSEPQARWKRVAMIYHRAETFFRQIFDQVATIRARVLLAYCRWSPLASSDVEIGGYPQNHQKGAGFQKYCMTSLTDRFRASFLFTSAFSLHPLLVHRHNFNITLRNGGLATPCSDNPWPIHRDFLRLFAIS